MDLDPTTITRGGEAIAAAASHPEGRKLLSIVSDYIGFRVEERKRIDRVRTDRAVVKEIQDTDPTKNQSDDLVLKHLAIRAADRHELKLLRQQKNIESIVKEAIQQLPPGAKVHETNGGWLESFFDYAQGISEPEIQAVWGKVLITESVKPSSFSLRTLSALRLFDSEDAKVLREIARHTCLTFGPSIQHAQVLSRDIKWSTMLHASSIGIVTENTSDIEYSYEPDETVPEEDVVPLEFCNGERLIAVSKYHMSIKWTGHVLTPLGTQLLRLPTEEPDKNAVTRAATYMKGHGYEIYATDAESSILYGYPMRHI